MLLSILAASPYPLHCSVAMRAFQGFSTGSFRRHCRTRDLVVTQVLQEAQGLRSSVVILCVLSSGQHGMAVANHAWPTY